MANPLGLNTRPLPDWRELERQRIIMAYLTGQVIPRVNWKCSHAAHEPTDTRHERIPHAPRHCSVEGCMRGTKALGYCKNHYLQARRAQMHTGERKAKWG